MPRGHGNQWQPLSWRRLVVHVKELHVHDRNKNVVLMVQSRKLSPSTLAIQTFHSSVALSRWRRRVPIDPGRMSNAPSRGDPRHAASKLRLPPLPQLREALALRRRSRLWRTASNARGTIRDQNTKRCAPRAKHALNFMDNSAGNELVVQSSRRRPFSEGWRLSAAPAALPYTALLLGLSLYGWGWRRRFCRRLWWVAN